MSKVEKPHVLVVDDNPETCVLLTAILQREFMVEVATDGHDAIEKLRVRTYGAILLDLRMPMYDGFSVLDFLKQSQPDALRSVIIVTALLHPRELERVRQYGIASIVPKPFDIETLVAAVKQVATPEDGLIGNICCAPIILLLANLLRQRLM